MRCRNSFQAEQDLGVVAVDHSGKAERRYPHQAAVFGCGTP